MSGDFFRPGKETTIIVKAKDLPQSIVVVGKDNRKMEYQLIPTNNYNGAQLSNKKEFIEE